MWILSIFEYRLLALARGRQCNIPCRPLADTKISMIYSEHDAEGRMAISIRKQ